MTNKNCNWRKFLFLLWNIPRDCYKYSIRSWNHNALSRKASGDTLPNYQDLRSLSLSTPYSLSYSFLIQCHRHSWYLEAHRGETRENYYNNRRRLYRLKPDANFQSGRFPTSRAIVNEIVPRVSVRIRRDAREGERDETAPLTAHPPPPSRNSWRHLEYLQKIIAQYRDSSLYRRLCQLWRFTATILLLSRYVLVRSVIRQQFRDDKVYQFC